MSWDIVIFNSTQKINTPEEVDEDQLVLTLFSLVFESSFNNIIKNGKHREIKGIDYTICYFEDNEPVSNTLINLYGENAIYPLINLSIKHNWQIFDTGLGQMLDLNDPSKNGYQNFQSYLNQILNNNS